MTESSTARRHGGAAGRSFPIAITPVQPQGRKHAESARQRASRAGPRRKTHYFRILPGPPFACSAAGAVGGARTGSSTVTERRPGYHVHAMQAAAAPSARSAGSHRSENAHVWARFSSARRGPVTIGMAEARGWGPWAVGQAVGLWQAAIEYGLYRGRGGPMASRRGLQHGYSGSRPRAEGLCHGLVWGRPAQPSEAKSSVTERRRRHQHCLQEANRVFLNP